MNNPFQTVEEYLNRIENKQQNILDLLNKKYLHQHVGDPQEGIVDNDTELGTASFKQSFTCPGNGNYNDYYPENNRLKQGAYKEKKAPLLRDRIELVQEHSDVDELQEGGEIGLIVR